MAGWLRGHAHLSARAAREIVETGRALEHLPAVAAAFADGQVTGQGYDGLVAVVRYYRHALDPDGPEPDPTEGRRFSIARHHDGTRGLAGQLDAVGAEKLHAALESLVQAGRTAGTPAAAPSSWPTRWCSWPTTPSPPAICRSTAPSSRTSSSRSTSATTPARSPIPGRRPPGPATSGPPPRPDGPPATPRSAGSCSTPTGSRSTSAGGPAAGARAERARRGGSGVL
jgi:ribosomal protein S10